MIFIELTAGFLMFSSGIVGTGTGSAQSTLPSTIPINRTIATATFIDRSNREDMAQFVKEYFADVPVLVEIARCESTYRHTGTRGDIIRGIVNPGDLGIMQINEYYHRKRAVELGYDLYTLGGNLAYARYLYEKEGVTPWRSSEKCWKGTQAYKESVLN